MAGVGMGPTRKTSMPLAHSPEVSAVSNTYPDSRVSLPMTTRWRPDPLRKYCPAANPSRRAISGVMGNILPWPRRPSVPKSLCFMQCSNAPPGAAYFFFKRVLMVSGFICTIRQPSGRTVS